MTAKRAIHTQVRLPLSVALGVVLQGIRIRLGRSIVTLLGVVLGIAFLMSMLTAQTIRRGVSAETEMRAELQRMINVLVDEVGPLQGRTVAIIQVGPLDEVERRYVLRLLSESVRQINWCSLDTGSAPEGGLPRDRIRNSDRDDVSTDASGVVLLGDGPAPSMEWATLLAAARQKVIAVSREKSQPAAAEGIAIAVLARKQRAEEQEEIDRELGRAKFRTGWIVVISLLVTVIGVSNAMLMSVTERFREIGTMKCLGALSSFVRQMFFIESSLIGLAGSVIGSLFGCLFSAAVFSASYGPGLVLAALGGSVGLVAVHFLLCIAAGVLLSVGAAIYPASFASRMVPATALRSNI